MNVSLLGGHSYVIKILYWPQFLISTLFLRNFKYWSAAQQRPPKKAEEAIKPILIKIVNYGPFLKERKKEHLSLKRRTSGINCLGTFYWCSQFWILLFARDFQKKRKCSSQKLTSFTCPNYFKFPSSYHFLPKRNFIKSRTTSTISYFEAQRCSQSLSKLEYPSNLINSS